MLNAEDKQFKLTDDGRILYQADASNPMPGEPVATVKKGASPLAPELEVMDNAVPAGQDAGAIKSRLEKWLTQNIATVLEPLVALDNTEGLAEPVSGICRQLFEAMGIMPREQVDGLTAALDQEMRQVLRAKKVRLGPVLVFLPDLNKPAGVRLRALLWALYHDKPLPAAVPNDGIVSQKVEPDADAAFYQAIGYPLYAGRAIRIDMLDRVINAVYEHARDGKFQARHEMAEWLGCPIEDLYAVLEAMGHHKIYDPAEQEAAVESGKETPEKAAEKTTDEAEQKDTGQAEPSKEDKAPEKPALATFRLKKGKAFEKSQPRQKKPSKKSGAKPKKPGKKPSKKPDKKSDRPRVIEVGPKPKAEDSPFAVLEQLKVKKDGSSS